jgi:RNA polymerase sigma-70 factor (ECF subfamily)
MSEDTEAIRRVLQGETSCFRVLVERYQAPLFCFLRNLVGDVADCEDLAQETFLAAFRNLALYRPDAAKFSTWLFTIARNKCLNWLEKRRPLGLSQLPEQADRRTPETALAESEFFKQLDAALAALPFEQKTAFILAEIQELSYEEIGRIEGIDIGTVKSRIARARGKLRAHFHEQVEHFS